MSIVLMNAGVVTSVAIQCAPKPLSVQLAFLALKSFDHVQVRVFWC